MLKALLKKQLQEYLFLLLYKNNNGKSSLSKARPLLYAVLFAYVFVFFFQALHAMMAQLCTPLVQQGMAWLYFAVSGLLGTVFAVLGSVFMTQSQLYDAKDNDLLLSLPIPPSYILCSRLLLLYLQTLAISALFFTPTMLAYIEVVGLTPAPLLCGAVLLLFLPVLNLTLTCIFGWLVAIISARTRHKNALSVVISLAFFVLYFFAYSQFDKGLALLLQNSEQVGNTVKTYLYPLYQMGHASTGDPLACALFVLLTVALFGIVYAVLARGFVKIATTRHTAKRVIFRKKKLRAASPFTALYRKEKRRFFHTPAYLLNCGLGTLFSLVAVVFLYVRRETLVFLPDLLPTAWDNPVALLLCLLLCALNSTNFVTAPSISLEGRTLWQLQSLPVHGRTVLLAKLRLHMLVSAPVASVALLASLWVFQTPPLLALLLTLFLLTYIALVGAVGLFLNLKMPNFVWTNETVVIKQGAPTLLAILTAWALLSLTVALYSAFGTAWSAVAFTALCLLIFAILLAALLTYLLTRGARLFSTLS